MTKEETIQALEDYISTEKLTTSQGIMLADTLNAYQRRNANVLKAMELLASMQGWNTQRCMKQGQHRSRGK